MPAFTAQRHEPTSVDRGLRRHGSQGIFRMLAPYMMMRNVPPTLGPGFTGNRKTHRRREHDEPDPGNICQTNSNDAHSGTYWLGHIGDFGPP